MMLEGEIVVMSLVEGTGIRGRVRRVEALPSGEPCVVVLEADHAGATAVFGWEVGDEVQIPWRSIVLYGPCS